MIAYFDTSAPDPAAIERLGSDATVLVAGDLDLCAAAGQLGIAGASTSSDDGRHDEGSPCG